MQIKKIETLADALEVLESEMWSLWAIFPPTVMNQHWLVVRPEGIRDVDGRIEVNMIEFDYARMGYSGEDWRTPDHIYMTHQCEGCHYPPDMCCGVGPDIENDLLGGRYTVIDLAQR